MNRLNIKSRKLSDQYIVCPHGPGSPQRCLPQLQHMGVPGLSPVLRAQLTKQRAAKEDTQSHIQTTGFQAFVQATDIF